MRVTLGVGVTRAGVDELITGLWSFANALGILTDDIGERTAAHGVEIDGLLVKDAGIPEAAVTAHEAALSILESQIADGTILARLAANEAISGTWSFAEDLALTKDLTVGEQMFVGSRDISLTGDINNLGTGAVVIQRITADGAHTITGLDGGAAGRIIILHNVGATNTWRLSNQNASSTAANRIITPQGDTKLVVSGAGLVMFYDGTDSRWRVAYNPVPTA